MKDWWKVIAKMALPLVRAASESKRAEDDNDTDKDDAIGVSLIYAADLLTALISDKPLPKAPAILK